MELTGINVEKHAMFKQLKNMWGPPVMYKLLYNPMNTIVKSTINHGEIGSLNSSTM